MQTGSNRVNMKIKEKNNEPQGNRRLKGSSVGHAKKATSEPEYVNYILKLIADPKKFAELMVLKEDRSKYPIVLTDGYVPGSALDKIIATIKNSTYTYPKDFDFDYTFHGEGNEETGYGFELIQEKLYFKNLPGSPILIGLAEEKSSGANPSPTMDMSKIEIEMFGNFQLTGTGIFKDVKGSGIGMFGVSTGFVVYHVALIKGWPL